MNFLLKIHVFYILIIEVVRGYAVAVGCSGKGNKDTLGFIKAIQITQSYIEGEEGCSVASHKRQLSSMPNFS